jgi:hypothetical protein
MADLYGATITYAHINESGQLVLLLSNDTVITCGNVVGPAGATGPQGVPGPRGAAGKDGTEIFVRPGPPDPAVGQPNDLWISSASWTLWVKSGMGWGAGMELMPGANNLDAATRRFNSGGSGGGRFFGMGAPSAGISGGGGGTGTLQPILQNDQPLPANAWTPVAFDPDGDAMIVDLYAASPNGTVFIEVAASKGLGADTGYSVVYEISMGTNPPNLTFRASVSGANQLQLEVNSDTALTTLRGRQMLI